jgi:hypothetical protein
MLQQQQTFSKPHMQRRTALKQLLIIAGGTLVIPACMNDTSQASIPLRHLKIDGKEEKLLAEISETIIPKTGIPGARDVYAHLFALKMIDDCYEPEQQRAFKDGLKEINAFSKERFKTDFSGSSAAQREALLTELEGRKEGEPLSSFYNMVKGLTIQGFLQSQYIMTNVLKYELVPGRYNGFAPVKTEYHQI